MGVKTSSLKAGVAPARTGAAEAPIPQVVLEASGVVGTWAHDYWAGQLALSATFADLLGLDPEAAAAGAAAVAAQGSKK